MFNNTRPIDYPIFKKAKFLGDKDDFLGYANQIRFAKNEEVEKVKQWLVDGIYYKVMQNGQLSFV